MARKKTYVMAGNRDDGLVYAELSMSEYLHIVLTRHLDLDADRRAVKMCAADRLYALYTNNTIEQLKHYNPRQED